MDYFARIYSLAQDVIERLEDEVTFGAAPAAVGAIPNGSMLVDRERYRLQLPGQPVQDWSSSTALWGAFLLLIDAPGHVLALSKGDRDLWRTSRVPELRDKLGKDTIKSEHGNGYRLMLEPIDAHLQL